MISATDELRRLLDERGVEHIDIGGMTEFVGLNGRICRAYTRPEPITVDVAVIAAQPAQAIAATLGRGTCRNRDADIYPGGMVFVCSACEGMSTDGQPSYCPNCGRKVVEE